jgi:hypothetical protein
MCFERWRMPRKLERTQKMLDSEDQREVPRVLPA